MTDRLQNLYEIFFSSLIDTSWALSASERLHSIQCVYSHKCKDKASMNTSRYLIEGTFSYNTINKWLFSLIKETHVLFTFAWAQVQAPADFLPFYPLPPLQVKPVSAF